MIKQSIQKSENLCLVRRDTRPRDSKTEKAASVRDSFDTWVNSVARTLVQSTYPEDQSNVDERGSKKSLTLTEITRVNFATVREGTEHRCWPPDVVLSFLAADVIKRK